MDVIPARAPTTMVVGASRGLGRAVAARLAQDGETVVAVSRSAPEQPVPGSVDTELLDATDPSTPALLLDRHDPDALVLVAGATPDMRPLQDHTWESFSAHWHGETQMTFRWLGEILRRPGGAVSRVIVVNSGAALAGSPLSGGYAGAKATQRFIASYAAQEARRAGRDLTISSVFPQFAPETAVGAAGVAAYAAQAGQPVEQFLASLPFPLLTPDVAATAVHDLLHADRTGVAAEYLLNGAGLHPLAPTGSAA